MPFDLTTQSADEFATLRSEDLTPAMAAQYLKNEQLVLRTFPEILRSLYPHNDLQEKLIAAFASDGNPDSARKKVRNWLSDANRPTAREDVFRIGFALGLTEAQTNHLLGKCTDCGIHYRDGHDVVYAWFLRTGKSYDEARDFYQSLPAVPYADTMPPDAPTHLTQQIRSQFTHIHSAEQLREVYMANLSAFGTLHLRAIHYFEKYLRQLVRPSDNEPDYSLDAIMEQYFSMHMPSSRKRSGYSGIQKLLKHDWPNTTALKNIRAHREDVSRKLLLLMYVITENILDDDYSELDEEYITLEERIEDHWWSINGILTDCGMATLDPRNASDWLILYAVCAAEDEGMRERMEHVIEYLFD